ncbi:NADH-quinone oxidoreductase subunit J [bacterium AH-315-P15]|nr:NADH-quinone oxidoreductase subunit J [bacterium AH-315-P15]
MIWSTIAFWVFASLAVIFAFGVISARNPVHSVLFLIGTFFQAAGLFVLLGAEFLAFILLVVYVGAVAVLFLFVVMMLDVDFVALKRGALHYVPVGGLVGLVMLAELALVVGTLGADPNIGSVQVSPTPDPAEVSNIAALGYILYTDYIYLFQAAGMVLLLAMIGAIVLTHRHKEHVKRQVIADQVGRTPEDAIEVVKVRPGQGI